ncbi:MAG: Ig-like domain repeat protein [Ruminococcus bromii]|nr:Ig-like domain repeat protein [Ruminococcus bromii]
MKTKISHLGRSSVSVILAVMMLLSTMLIGTISVNAADYFTVGDTLYLDISGASYDATEANAGFYIKFYKQGHNDFSWSKLSQIKDKVYSGTVPTGEWDRAVFTRVNSQTFDSTKSWIASTVYSSATTTISDKGNHNCWSLNNGDMKGTWTTYSDGSGGGSTSTAYYVTGEKGLINGTDKWTPKQKLDKMTYSDTDGYYSITYTDRTSGTYQFKITDDNSSWFGYNEFTVEPGIGCKIGNSDGNISVKFDQKSNITIKFNIDSEGKKHLYVIAESALSKVADSVTLTASPETVKVGDSVTLTAVVDNPISANLKYTFAKTSGGDATVVQDNNKLTVTPTAAGTYKYKVTVSADGYSPVTSNEVSFTVTDSVEYYLAGRIKQNGSSDWVNSIDSTYKFTQSDTEGLYYYKSAYTPKRWSDTAGDLQQYFYIIDSSSKMYGSKDNQTDNTPKVLTSTDDKSTLEQISGTNNTKTLTYISNQENTSVATFWLDTRNGKYNLWYTTALSHKVNVAEGVSATVDKETATAGEKVTVTATPGTGEVLDTVTVVGADNKSVTTTVSGNTATFIMPDQDVTVKEVTFRTAETYTVNFSSSNKTYGTVSAMKGTTPITSSPATVTEGDTVTFTAKPKDGYALSDWTVNGVSASSTANPYTITVQKDTTVVANFKVEDSGTIVNNMYFLYGSTNDPRSWEGQQGKQKYNVYEKDGKYIVTLNKEHYKQLYFAFSTSNYYKNMTPKDKLAGVNSDNPVDLRLVTTSKESFNADNTQYVFGMMSIENENSEYIGDIKIIYDLTANTYTVKATKDSVSDTTVNIVGKDGTVRKDYYGKTTSALGDTTLKVTSPDGTTTITAIDSCNFDGHSQGVTAKKVPYGSKVTITTTIKSDATFAGHKGSEYYVKGFSINGFTGGVLTQQAGNSHTSDVYEYTFTVKEDVYADVSTIEITPIYFLKDDSDCVTFYVENFMDAKDKWGDTIACYAYYSSEHALGDYPGQPMVNAEGSIYMQIPKYIGGDTSNVVKGITLNNYVWDFVHVSGDDKARESKNCQTYDYDDFKYLANMSKVNSSDSAADIKNIVYRFKYHTYNNTSAEAGNVPKDTLTGTNVDNTKYEVFVDYYDKPTDIFGTIIKGNDAVTVDTVKSQSEYLTIVSDGYVNYYKDSAKYLGQYATKWYIYNKAGQKVAALPPSALLYGLTKSSSELENLVTQDTAPADFMSDSGASTNLISGYWTSFKSLYTGYAGKYAIINYESSIHSSGRNGAEKQPGERCDGRWYYSVDNAKITGDIKIEYADTLDSFTTMTGVKTDTFIEGTATGKNTAAEAYFTSPADQSTAVKPTHVETTSDNSENFKFTVGATSSTTSGYTFVGWYRLIDDTYKAVNDPSELNKTTGQVARNANVVLVARYIKTPGGTMTFHHSLYNGTNAGGGKATTEIQVVVKSSDGSKEYYNSGRIDSTASIDQKTISEIVAGQQDAKITVTLYTTTKNLYNFNGYYSAENTTVTKPFTTGFTTEVSGDRKEGLVTKSEYTFSFNDYYTIHKDTLIDNAGTVYYNFYSDITSIKVPYKVQFSYKDRMGEQKYYNKAGYVDPENTSSYTFVENATNVEGVESHSVKVTLTDSFILSLAPYESNFTKNLTWDKPTDSMPFDSSVSKSIASAVVNSTQSNRTIHLSVYRDGKGDPTPLTNTKGHFELFTKNGSPELPYGSVFYTSNGDGTYTYDITADKTYTDESGNELKFMYWEIYSDQKCMPEDLVIKAYNSEGHFSYVAYDNCWIVPVYGESSTPVASVKGVYTSTQFMEVTRNQWTADTNSNFAGFDADDMTSLNTAKDFIKEKGEDKLYADFVLNFFYNGKQLSVFDPNSENVKAGVLIQRLELDENETGTGYITDLDHYAKKYNKTELDAAKDDAINKIKNNQSTIKSVKQQIDNSKLDNKNRLQYYTLFNNVKGNNNCVFRLYTYIQYTDANGETAVELSAPVYFTFYDIANKS